MTPKARDRIERTLAACDGWPTPTEAAMDALFGHTRDCLREIDRQERIIARLREALRDIVDGQGCGPIGDGDCCDLRCRNVGREALAYDGSEPA